MNWTTQPPTVPGFYWHRAPGNRTQVCEVIGNHGIFAEPGTLYVAFSTGPLSYDWLKLPGDSDLPEGSEWYGPLEVPQ